MSLFDDNYLNDAPLGHAGGIGAMSVSYYSTTSSEPIYNHTVPYYTYTSTPRTTEITGQQIVNALRYDSYSMNQFWRILVAHASPADLAILVDLGLRQLKFDASHGTKEHQLDFNDLLTPIPIVSETKVERAVKI
jgi:hypothetical protein